jgi:hypothetical protein
MRWLCIGVLLVACGRDAREPAERAPAPLPAAEVERGRTACAAYVERVCRCAGGQADLASECELARSRPEALELTLEVLAARGAPGDLGAAQLNARKIIKACLEADSRLDPASCPRAVSAR